MGKYSGTVDDYLQAKDGTLAIAVEERVISIYDPETGKIHKLRIDVSERGGKDLDKVVDKAYKDVAAAQEELVRIVDSIRANGGGTVVSRARRGAAKNSSAPASEPSRTAPESAIGVFTEAPAEHYE